MTAPPRNVDGQSISITLPFFLTPQEAFVTMRGGEYLCIPGTRALAAIAEGLAG